MRVDFETDVGVVRSSNQDSCDCGLFSPNSAWAIVCDGMGGANGGNVASALAVETIREEVLSGFDENMSKQNLKNLMVNAINRANEKVHETALAQPELHGMGTTVVLLIATKGTLHVAHIGDSRAYLRHNGVLTQITMDHSYVQDLVNFGQITQEEARFHPQRNIITGCWVSMRQCAAITLPGISLRGIWPWPVPMDFPTTWRKNCWRNTWNNTGKRAMPFPKS